MNKFKKNPRFISSKSVENDSKSPIMRYKMCRSNIQLYDDTSPNSPRFSESYTQLYTYVCCFAAVLTHSLFAPMTNTYMETKHIDLSVYVGTQSEG